MESQRSVSDRLQGERPEDSNRDDLLSDHVQDSSAESVLRPQRDDRRAQEQEALSRGPPDGIRMATEEGTAEEELAMLLKKADTASKAVKIYSSSAEEGLHQLLLSYEELLSIEAKSKPEQLRDMRSEIQACTTRLQEALQEISLLTAEVQELGARFGQLEKPQEHQPK